MWQTVCFTHNTNVTGLLRSGNVNFCFIMVCFGLFVFFLPGIKSPTCPPACLGGFGFTEKDLEVLLFKLDNQQEEERSMSSTL